MRSIVFAFAAVAALGPSLQVSAQDAAAVPSAPVTNSAAEGKWNTDEMVCKIQPPETGTRLGERRECHSTREWERMLAAEQQQVFKAQVQFGETCGEISWGGC
jgi:hypothetical protein